MTTEFAVTIGLGFFVSLMTTLVLIKGALYWKNRDPYDGEFDENPS